MNFDAFKILPVNVKLILLALCGMLVNICVLMSHTWSNRMDYSFGYIAPFFVIYILYDRGEKILSYYKDDDANPSDGAASEQLPSILVFLINFVFWGMLICGLAGYALSAFIFHASRSYAMPVFTMAWCFSFSAYAMIFLASSTNAKGESKPMRERLKFLLLFTFPCFIWLVAAPLAEAIESRISLFLLSIVADIIYWVMDFFGFIVKLKGNVLEFPSGTVGVADACSGIRSLTACIFAGSFLAAAMLDKFWKKAALVILSMALAFFNNILRALFLAFWAYENGSASISGEVHDYAGYFVLGMTVIGLLIFVSLFNLNPVPKEFRNAPKTGDNAETKKSD